MLLIDFPMDAVVFLFIYLFIFNWHLQELEWVFCVE